MVQIERSGKTILDKIEICPRQNVLPRQYLHQKRKNPAREEEFESYPKKY